MGSASDEQILDEIKLNILQEKRHYLLKFLVPDRYHAYLRSVFILDEDDQQRIDHQVTRRDKAGQLLDILQTKGGEAYEALVTAIRLAKTQNFLVEDLHKEYEKRRNKYYDLVNQTREKELVINNNCHPRPGRPQKQSSEHQEDSPEPQRKSEQYSSIPSASACGGSPKPKKNTSDSTEVIFDQQHGGRNSQVVKQKDKVPSLPQQVPLNSGIPLTVSDPEIRTMKISVDDETITVMGPPVNRFRMGEMESKSMATPVDVPPRVPSSIRTPPQSLPTTCQSHTHAPTQDKITKQQRNEKQAASSKMFPRASSKSNDDDLTYQPDPQGKSLSENGQGSTESLDRDNMSSDQSDITVSIENRIRTCDTDSSSLLPTTIQDLSDEESDEVEITALKQVVNDISFVDSRDSVVSDEQSFESDKIYRESSSSV